MSGYDLMKSKLLYDLVKNIDEAAALKLITDPTVNVNYSPRSNILWHATSHEKNLKIAQALLGHPNINVNQAGSLGRTALFGAAFHGQDKAVGMLLGHPDIDVNQADIDGWTPLWMASGFQYDAVVGLLLKHPDINVNQADNHGWTPLYAAAYDGHEKVIKQLLEHPNINPHQATKDGSTLLWIACSHGHETAVKMLLASNHLIDVLATPYNEQLTAAEKAKVRYPAIFELVKSFGPSNDPIETQARQAKIRWRLRKELGLNVKDAAAFLALVVLLSDGYLQFSQTTFDGKANRFLQINLSLPLELQTRICNLVYERNAFTII